MLLHQSREPKNRKMLKQFSFPGIRTLLRVFHKAERGKRFLGHGRPANREDEIEDSCERLH